MGCLYKLEFPNGKSYIGISNRTAEHRFKGHMAAVRQGESYLLCKAIKKYGAENVKIITLVVAEDWDYLLLIERNAVRVYGTKAPLGYNMTEGGEGALGTIVSQATRERMSIAQRAANEKDPELRIRRTKHFKGRKAWNDGIKTGICYFSSKGMKRSEEFKANLRGNKFGEALKGRPQETTHKVRRSVSRATAWAQKLGRPLSLILKKE